ncbi:DUF2341 domain-containing protein [archaeon]|nr:DUF2341 domain-containing protein [archaeon]
MKKGLTPVVSTVLLIGLAFMLGLGLYFWAASPTPGPEPTKPAIITVRPVSVSDGKFLITNTGMQEITLSQLQTSHPSLTCTFDENVTITPGKSAACNMMPIASKGITFFGNDNNGIAITPFLLKLTHTEVKDVSYFPVSASTPNWWNTSWSKRKPLTIQNSLSDSENWWNNSWQRRLPITLDNTGAQLSNFTIKVQFAYDNDMKTNFNDLRFIDSDNSTELDHWLEDYNSTNATFWVEVPTLSANVSTIWAYYGNSGADSESNGTETFLFFDDFSSDSLTVTAGDPITAAKNFTEIPNIGFELYSKMEALEGHTASTFWSWVVPFYLIDLSEDDYARGCFYSRSGSYYKQLHVYNNSVSEGGESGYRYSDGYNYTILLRHIPGERFRYQLFNYSSDSSLNDCTVATSMTFYPDQYQLRARCSGACDDGYITYNATGDFYEVSGDYDSDEVKERFYWVFITKFDPDSVSVSPGSEEQYTNANLTDYPLLVNVSYDTDMNSNFSDLRFIDTDNSTELDYWIENYSDSSYAETWVKINSSTGNKTIWLYYTNSEANNESNGTAVFSYYDHWISDNTGDWLYGVPAANSPYRWQNTLSFNASRQLRAKSTLENWWSGAWDYTDFGWTSDKSTKLSLTNHVTLQWHQRTDQGANSTNIPVRLLVRANSENVYTDFINVTKPSSSDELYLTLEYSQDNVSYTWEYVNNGTILASDYIDNASQIPSLSNVTYLVIGQLSCCPDDYFNQVSSDYLQWGNPSLNGGMEWKTDYWFIRTYSTDPQISTGNEVTYSAGDGSTELTYAVNDPDGLQWVNLTEGGSSVSSTAITGCNSFYTNTYSSYNSDETYLVWYKDCEGIIESLTIE